MGLGHCKCINAVLPWEHKKKQHEILLLSSKRSLNAKNRSSLSPIKPVFAVFQRSKSYVAIFWTKVSSLRNIVKENHNSNKFVNYLQEGCTKFHNGVPSSISKATSPTWESALFYLVEKTYFFGENLSTEEFWRKFQRLPS